MITFGNFYQRRNNIIQKTQTQVLDRYKNFKKINAEFNKKLSQIYWSIVHIQYIFECDKEFCKVYGYDIKMENIWKKIHKNICDLTYPNSIYLFFKSSKRNKISPYLIENINANANPDIEAKSIKILNCIDTFDVDGKEYYSSNHGIKKHLHVDSNTSIRFDKGLIQNEGDVICIDHLNIFYCRNEAGQLNTKIFKGLSPKYQKHLIDITKGEINEHKLKTAISIILDMKAILVKNFMEQNSVESDEQ